MDPSGYSGDCDSKDINTNRVTSGDDYGKLVDADVEKNTKVNGTYAESEANSKILRDELYSMGVPNPPYLNAAHHVVPVNDPRAARARELIESAGSIDLNSAANGVFLPIEDNGLIGDAALHNGNYSSDYIESVTKRLVKLTESDKTNNQESILNEMSSIKNGVLDGTIKLNN